MAVNNKAAAKLFVKAWQNRGDEKQDTQQFWMDLLQEVYGIRHPSRCIKFEVPAQKQKKKGTDFKDAVINRFTSNAVLVEQKGKDKKLDESIRQSDGTLLTPFEQAKRYDDQSGYGDKARWIITCNFQNFWIYDMSKTGSDLFAPVAKLELKDLSDHLNWLDIIADAESEEEHSFKEETAVSVKAGELVGIMYDALQKNYLHPEDPFSQRSLNILCVRLVFCLYAEDSGLFEHGEKQFHDYLTQFNASQMRNALIDLFKVLNTPAEPFDMRAPMYLSDDLNAFPYVNGGLFEEEIEIPRFTDEIVDILLNKESMGFDWSVISPTIFGAVFESTLNQKTRRAQGMHYTSIENIHKVIDPLFLDELKRRLEFLKANSSTTQKQLIDYQNSLTSLVFLDPAAGSGNFLTETYLCLRRLENEVISILNKGAQRMVFDPTYSPIKVSIQQFYGIEINDFAVSVAQTALWIAEHKMFKETEDILNMKMNFLPLKTFTHIHEGNALTTDWNNVVLASKVQYIISNPPFIGARKMDQGSNQKREIEELFAEIKDVQDLDYVTGWYKKAAVYIQNTNIEVGFVSTNSICQGAQVPILWDELIHKFHICINFAHQTFEWNSEAAEKAHVYVIIIGFSTINKKEKQLFTYKTVKSNSEKLIVSYINPYLLPIDCGFVSAQKVPLCNVPIMMFGNQPRDGGNLVVTKDEYSETVKKEPGIKKWLHPYIGADEFLNNKERWCLWLVDATPKDINTSKFLKERVSAVRTFRENSKAKTTNGYARTPSLFAQRPIVNTDYIAIPETTTSNRKYVPMGFMDKSVIASNLLMIIPDATIIQFGILESIVHMAWMRVVCGRLGNGYRYSKEIVYNCFPWPSPTDAEKTKIAKSAQSILDARAQYSDSSLFDLYDPNTMPAELSLAHHANDKAVMEAYGFNQELTEMEVVEKLMEMYQHLKSLKADSEGVTAR